MRKLAHSLGVLLVASVLTAMVWPLTDGMRIIEASPIKNWTSNEQITYNDLNTNFNHLHANLGHGHGPIITANDIASNAGIRPEQTTFGNAVSRNLVFEGTFLKNPDAGAAYLPINYSGSLAVTVAKVSTTGAIITGASASGLLPDAGTSMYTVFYKPTSSSLGGSGLWLCYDAVTSSLLYSPLSVSISCQDVTTWGTPTAGNPPGLSVEVYSNKVQ